MGTIVDVLGWQAYAFFQGATLTGWWVLAHECGHGGFSASQFVNDCVGLVLHSVLLVAELARQAPRQNKSPHGRRDAQSQYPGRNRRSRLCGPVPCDWGRGFCRISTLCASRRGVARLLSDERD